VLGEVQGGQVKVASGLSAGERIVTAGVSSLREGMKVRPLDAR
jgi:multidrug efflux pump subunit AcrA (membrane-fusion protein)